MRITRRGALGGAMAGAGALPAWRAQAQGAASGGKPFAGQTVKLMIVRATQFQLQAKHHAEFEEATGAKVSVTEVPFPTMREKLTAELVAQSADYDVVSVMDAWIPSMTGYLRPIDEHLKSAGVDANRYPAAFLNAGQVRGQLYGVPMRCHVQVLFYRKDIFDKLGLKPPRTWDEVVEAGKAVQAKTELAGLALPYAKNNGQNLQLWYNFLWGRGTDVFDAKLAPTFNNPAGLQATQDYVDLMLKHKITPVGCAGFTEQDATQSMVQGRSAMLPCWWWVVSQFSGESAAVKRDQVGFVTLPTYTGGQPTTFTNVWIFGVNKLSKSSDAALAYLDWVSRPQLEKQVLLDPAGNDVVACQWSNIRDPEVNARWNGLQQTGGQELEHSHGLPQFAELPQVQDVLETAMSNIASGGATVPDAMNAAAEAVARITRRVRL